VAEKWVARSGRSDIVEECIGPASARPHGPDSFLPAHHAKECCHAVLGILLGCIKENKIMEESVLLPWMPFLEASIDPD
jgi:hypothetical protein